MMITMLTSTCKPLLRKARIWLNVFAIQVENADVVCGLHVTRFYGKFIKL